ncbi:MAG: tRNA (adenosine(37)-N6)-dimethylallyltransferase MiaA [Candidatus Shikimatogenerans sp. JK-2022]|nr:tRNA (adenosine(37)-N6)-dimethylallyltransferase MiaA [Candidatus Shikimatogenerans bostrichidophilus]
MKLLISIIGPTGIGKTKITIKLAKYFKSKIISCDSRQFYKELKIGTSCPSNKDLKKIKHYFIGHISIFKNYNVYKFEQEALKKIKKLFKFYKIIFLVGGSFLYEKSIIEGINYIPNIKNKKKLFLFRKKMLKKSNNFLIKKIKKEDYIFYKEYLNNKKDKIKIIRALEVKYFNNIKISTYYKKKKKKRPFKNFLRICLIDKRKNIYKNINNKVDNMIKNGLFNEVKKLYKYRKLKSLNTIGYKEFYKNYKNKNINYIINLIKKNTRNYAKKQLIWLKKLNNIIYFYPNYKKIKKYIKNYINK